MRTGDDDQSAAALPFGTQPGIEERVRMGDCYRGPGSYEKSTITPNVLNLRQMKSISVAPESDVQSVHLARSSYMRSDKHRPKL